MHKAADDSIPESSNSFTCQLNRAICRTRVLLEQAYGIIKRSFNVLHDGFRVEPKQAAEYIVACVLLHDIGIDRNDVVVRNVHDTDRKLST